VPTESETTCNALQKLGYHVRLINQNKRGRGAEGQRGQRGRGAEVGQRAEEAEGQRAEGQRGRGQGQRGRGVRESTIRL